MNKTEITQEILKQLLQYCPKTGIFTRIVTVSPNALKGDFAGNINSAGYLRLEINGKEYLNHRLVWLYFYGFLPPGQIDHINGIRLDNRILNLRLANTLQNSQNQRVAHKNNKSSNLIGVSWVKKREKFRAQISIQGKDKFLGYFDDKNEAHKAYIEYKRKHHEFCTL